MNLVKLALSTFFGLGLIPVAPGTAGAAGAAAMAFALQRYTGSARLAALIILAIICLPAPALARWAESHFAKEDPRQFVLDEAAGMLLTILLVPWRWTALICIVGFAAFRLMDIAKPWPIRKVEKLPAGWGVLLDDLLAGVYAAAVSIALIFAVHAMPWTES